VVTLDSPKMKDGGNDFERLATISSLGSASTSSRSSSAPDFSSDLISPSSRFSKSGTVAGTGLPSRDWMFLDPWTSSQWTKYQQRPTLPKSWV
jgi:hypothetical protein